MLTLGIILYNLNLLLNYHSITQKGHFLTLMKIFMHFVLMQQVSENIGRYSNVFCLRILYSNSTRGKGIVTSILQKVEQNELEN